MIMKKIRMAIAALAMLTTILLVSFKKAPAPSIKGKVSPAWYAVHAWAITETDTLYTTITDGNFDFPNAKPGVYRIIIEARSPYRHMAKDGIIVKDGEATDVSLSLQKY
jgi:hypothetical protein